MLAFHERMIILRLAHGSGKYHSLDFHAWSSLSLETPQTKIFHSTHRNRGCAAGKDEAREDTVLSSAQALS